MRYFPILLGDKSSYAKSNEFTYLYSLQMGNASGYSTLFIHALFVYQPAQNELTLRFVFDGIWLET